MYYAMDETGNAAFFEEVCDCEFGDLDTIYVHRDVSRKESDFSELFENSESDLDNE